MTSQCSIIGSADGFRTIQLLVKTQRNVLIMVIANDDMLSQKKIPPAASCCCCITTTSLSEYPTNKIVVSGCRI